MINIHLFKQLIQLAGYDSQNASSLLNDNPEDMCIGLILDGDKINGIKIVKKDSDKPNVLKITDENSFFHKTKEQIQELIDTAKKIASQNAPLADLENFTEIAQTLFYKARIWQDEDALQQLLRETRQTNFIKSLTDEFNDKLTALRQTIGINFNLLSFLRNHNYEFIERYEEGFWANIKNFVKENASSFARSNLMQLLKNKYPNLFETVKDATELVSTVISAINNVVPSRFKNSLYNSITSIIKGITDFLNQIFSPKENKVRRPAFITREESSASEETITRLTPQSPGILNQFTNPREIDIKDLRCQKLLNMKYSEFKKILQAEENNYQVIYIIGKTLSGSQRVEGYQIVPESKLSERLKELNENLEEQGKYAIRETHDAILLRTKEGLKALDRMFTENHINADLNYYFSDFATTTAMENPQIIIHKEGQTAFTGDKSSIERMIEIDRNSFGGEGRFKHPKLTRVVIPKENIIDNPLFKNMLEIISRKDFGIKPEENISEIRRLRL